MRNFFFLIMVILGVNCQSQDIKGSWKVISYEDEIAYFNKSTDSISYKDSSRKNEADNFKKRRLLFVIMIPLMLLFTARHETLCCCYSVLIL